MDCHHLDGRRLNGEFELNGTMIEESQRLNRLKSGNLNPGSVFDLHKSLDQEKYGKEVEKKSAVFDPESETSSGDEGGSESESTEISESEFESGYDSRSKRKRKHRKKSTFNQRRSRKKVHKSDSDESSESSEEERHRRRHSRKSGKKQSKHKKSKRSSSGSTGDRKGRKNNQDKKKRRRKSGPEADVKTKAERDQAVKLNECFQKKHKVETLHLWPVIGPGTEPSPEIGPMPLPKAPVLPADRGRDRALRPGEGDAIAQFVQQGKRIPRRGEVGLTADEITKYENAGYVMSGDRHKKMTAVRTRKENQVYSAEDKRALAMFNFEEKAKKEQLVMASLRRLVQRHTGESDD